MSLAPALELQGGDWYDIMDAPLDIPANISIAANSATVNVELERFFLPVRRDMGLQICICTQN